MKLKKILLACSAALASSQVMADNLMDIYQVALVKDTQLLQVMAQRDAAFEQINESKAARLPQIGYSAAAEYTFADNSERDPSDFSNTNLNAGLGLDQSIYNRSIWVNLTTSEKIASQTDVALNLSKQTLILRVADAYFDVLKSIDNLTFVLANKEAVAQQLEQTKQRYEVGLTAITDVHEAQAEFDRTVATEIISRNTLENSYEALYELTGTEFRDLEVLDTARFGAVPPEGSRETWADTANQYNLELHIQRIGVEIAEQNIELAKSGYQPVIGLTANVGVSSTSYQDSAIDSVSGSNLSSAGIGLNISGPIYTGGAIKSRVRQAEYGYVEASEALEQSARAVLTSVHSNFNNVNASIRSLEAFEQTVVSADSALQATQAGFDVGTRTIVDVLDATRSLYQSQQELANARYDYILSMMNLKLSAGTLSQQDVEAITAGLMPAPIDPEQL